MTTLPSCRCQRRITWAGVVPWWPAIVSIVSVVEQGALGERAPGLGGDAVLGVPGAQLGLLEVRVQLDLVDGRQLLGLALEPLEVLDAEVGDADRARVALLLDPFEGAPGVEVAVLARHRPVDQVEVDVVHPEPPQAALAGRQRRVVALLGVPQLGRDEDLLAGRGRRRRSPRPRPPRCGRRRRCRCGGSRPSSASSTASWVSAGGTWKTPKPSCGISTPSCRVTVGIEVASAICSSVPVLERDTQPTLPAGGAATMTTASGQLVARPIASSGKAEHDAEVGAHRGAAGEAGGVRAGAGDDADEKDEAGDSEADPEDGWHDGGENRPQADGPEPSAYERQLIAGRSCTSRYWPVDGLVTPLVSGPRDDRSLCLCAGDRGSP